MNQLELSAAFGGRRRTRRRAGRRFRRGGCRPRTDLAARAAQRRRPVGDVGHPDRGWSARWMPSMNRVRRPTQYEAAGSDIVLSMAQRARRDNHRDRRLPRHHDLAARCRHPGHPRRGQGRGPELCRVCLILISSWDIEPGAVLGRARPPISKLRPVKSVEDPSSVGIARLQRESPGRTVRSGVSLQGRPC